MGGRVVLRLRLVVFGRVTRTGGRVTGDGTGAGFGASVGLGFGFALGTGFGFGFGFGAVVGMAFGFDGSARASSAPRVKEVTARKVVLQSLKARTREPFGRVFWFTTFRQFYKCA